MDKEDGEMSDGNEMLVDDVEELPVAKEPSCTTLLFKADKDGVLIQELEKVDATKLEERAVRFGLDQISRRLVTQKQIDELYAEAGIESGNERHFRFDTLHLKGIDGLSTREIFEYLEDYKPVSIELIDDVSCNVVCQDHISAALALLVHSREIRNEKLKTMISDKFNYHWRQGMPHLKKDLIIMRFATNGDRKVSKKKSEVEQSQHDIDQSMDPISKNPWGDLCQSWGVYDHQEIFQRKLPKNDYEDDIIDTEEFPNERIKIKNKKLAMRLGKRWKLSKDSNDSSSDSEWKKKTKTPRMRMHADDEESKKRKKQVPEINVSSNTDTDKYAPLSIEVLNSRSNYVPKESTTKLSDKFKRRPNNNISHRDNVQSRLGVKVEPRDKSISDNYSSDESEHYVMSRVEKVQKQSSSSVWSRLETKPKNESSQSDLRHILKSKKQPKSSDLRDRLGSNTKKSNIRIEFDNDYND